MLPNDKYQVYLAGCNWIFKKTIEECLGNKYFAKAVSLHTFAIKRKNNGDDVYFDGKKLSPDERFHELEESYSSAVIRFLNAKEPDCQIVLSEAQTYTADDWVDIIYWALSFQSLEDYSGTWVLDCIFRQLTDRFNMAFRNSVLLCQDFCEVQKIVWDVEEYIDRYMQRMFFPFNMNLVDSLSGEYYEKSECRANMIFLPDKTSELLETEDWSYRIEKIDFISHNARIIRKLLQIAQENLYLVLEADIEAELYKVMGIIPKEILDNKLKNDNDSIPCIEVRIRNHMVWDIFLNDKYILTCQNGNYKMNIPFGTSVITKILIKDLINYFGDSENEYEVLSQNIYQSTKQSHGTMLVIMNTDIIKREVSRLGSRKYGFQELVLPPVQEQTENIQHLSAIDGCIMIDTTGKVWGIGMILDGISMEDGDMSRGARYNSAKKYCSYLRSQYEQEEKLGMIIIISEDGSVDVMPA